MIQTNARGLRPGDRIEHEGEPVTIASVDNVDGWIEIETTDGRSIHVRWSRLYDVERSEK